MNVLFILIDALRYDRLGRSGYRPNPSPFLDKLMSTGISASRAYALGCPTQFVLPSIMTSSLPLDDGGYESGLLKRSPSWIEILKAAGYRTGGFVTAGWISSYDGYYRGFDDFYELFDLPIFIFTVLDIRIGYYLKLFKANQISFNYCQEMIESYMTPFFDFLISFCRKKRQEISRGFPIFTAGIHGRDFTALETIFSQERERYRSGIKSYIGTMIEQNCGNLPFFYLALIQAARPKPSAAYMMENVKQWIGSLDGKRPFFAWVHLMDAHDGNYRTHDISLPENFEREDVIRMAVLESQIHSAQPDYKGSLAYDLAIAYVDNQIKRMVAFLEEKNLINDTLIVIMADHGLPTAFPNRNLQGIDHFFEEYVHVPISFIHPRLPEKEIDGLVTLMDAGPTILDILGIPIPGHFKGSPLTNGAGVPRQREHVILEHLGLGPGDLNIKPIKLCVVGRNHKLIYTNPPNRKNGEGMVEGFFDLSADPMESNNLVEDPGLRPIISNMQAIAQKRCRTIRC